MDATFDFGPLMEDWEGLRRLARSLVRGDASAEDVLQDAWAAVARGAAPTRDGDLRAWFRGVIRNIAAKRNRGEWRRHQRELRVALASQGRETPSPDEVAARLEERRVVLESLQRLADPQRHVLYLRYFEDLSPTAIAARLGVPLATVKSWLHRGLDSLRSTLDGRHQGRRHAWMIALMPLSDDDAPSIPAPPVASGTPTAAVVAAGSVAMIVGIATFVVVRANSAIEGAHALEAVGPTASAETTLAARTIADDHRVTGGLDAPFAADAHYARFTGRVVDQSGTAVEGAEVEFCSDDGTGSTARTDGVGRFVLAGDRNPGTTTARLIEARMGERAALAEVWVAPRRPWAPVAGTPPEDVGTLVLHEAHGVDALVVGAEGLPAASVRVRLLPDFNYAPAYAEATTDDGGHARFEGVPAGTYRLVAHAEGRGNAAQEVVLPRTDRALVALRLTRGRTVDLAVVDEETRVPVEGATVRVRERGSVPGGACVSTQWRYPESAPSDVRGRVRVDGVNPSADFLDVSVEAPGFTESRQWVQVSPDGDSVVVLRRSPTVRWRVVGPGKPALPDGTVLPVYYSSGRDEPTQAHVENGVIVVTGLMGRPFHAIAVAPDSSGAALDWDGRSTHELSTEFAPMQDVDLVLERFDGSPAAGWAVAVGVDDRSTARTLVTDSRGCASLGPLPAGMAILSLFNAPAVPVSEVRLARFDATTTRKLRLRLGRPKELILTISVGGQPLVASAGDSAALRVYDAASNAGLRWSGIGAGTYRVGLPPGEEPDDRRTFDGDAHGVLVVVSGCAPARCRLPRARADEPVRASVDLVHAGSFNVDVLEPIDEGFALVRPTWDPRIPDWVGGYEPAVERWDAAARSWATIASPFRRVERVERVLPRSSRWAVGLLEPGRYRAVDPITGQASEPIEVASGASMSGARIDLTCVGVVRGAVAVPHGFDPRDAWVECEDVGGSAGSDSHVPRSVVGDDGTFELRVSGAHPVRLVARHPLLIPDASEGNALVVGAAAGVRLRLGLGTPVHATLRLPAGVDSTLPLGSIGRVHLRDASRPHGAVVERTLVATPADAAVGPDECEVRFCSVPPGVYTLWIDVPGFAPARIPAAGLGADATDLGRVPMSRGSTLRVRLRADVSAPIWGVRVTATPHDAPTVERWATGDVSKTRDLELWGLAAGAHRIRVEVQRRHFDPFVVVGADREVDVDGASETAIDVDLR